MSTDKGADRRRKFLRMNWSRVTDLADRFKAEHGRYPFAVTLSKNHILAVDSAHEVVRMAGKAVGPELQRELTVVELDHQENYFVLVEKAGFMRTTYQSFSLRLIAEKHPNAELRIFSEADMIAPHKEQGQ